MIYYEAGGVMKITYWSDYACPYCYIGEIRLKKAIANVPELGEVELEMKAFQLDPDAGEHATGDTQTRFAKKYGLTIDHAGRSVEHIAQMGRAEGLDFNYAETQFTNTMDAHRLTKLAQSKGDPALAQRVVDALFHAYFGENKELADKALLQEIGVSCGLDANEVTDLLDSDQYRGEVIVDEREAARYGIHAVPFFVIGQQGLSGAYPVEAMEQVLRETLKSLPQDPPAQGMQCGPDGCRLG